jgi:transcriptional regulator
MYVPRHFARDEIAEAHALIEAHPFATLIVTLEGRLEGVHLPFLIDRGRGPLGTLRAHLARANPVWHAFEEGREALIVFQGVDGYISPDWYDSEGQVPTWNYVVAHAYGTPAPLDAAATRSVLEALSARHEAALAPKPPWTLDKLAPERIELLLRAIVGFEIPLSRIETKAKLSQNRSEADVARAVAALRARGGTAERELAGFMELAKVPRPAG